MFSLHDTRDIVLKNISLNDNKIYDDALHLVYCKNILLENILIKNAFSDALDIDISDEIFIKKSIFLNPKNDSIDIMESRILVDGTEIYNSGDKGISVGENSNAIIHNSYLNSNNIGIAVKDNSIAKVVHTDFNNNIIQVGSYQKNYKYGNGGKINIFKSNFNSETNKIESDIKNYVKSPFTIVHLNAWKTKPKMKKYFDATGTQRGAYRAHNDGYPPGHIKCMIYLQPLDDFSGKIKVLDKLFESEKAGCAVMFDQNLRHEAIAGNKNYRYVLELTILRTVVKTNMLKHYDGEPGYTWLKQAYYAYL